MKTRLLILLMLFVQISFSQNYKFDKLAIYEGSDNFSNPVYCNSNDSNYFMRVISSYKKQEAIIYDIKQMKTHTFEITTDKSVTDSTVLTFTYSHSARVKDYERSSYSYEYVKIKEDSIYNYSNLIYYKINSKNKNIQNIVELKIRKDTVSYFPLFRFSTMHTLEFKSDLNFEIGGIIESSKTTKKKQNEFEFILKEFQDFDLELVINEENHAKQFEKENGKHR